MPIFIIYKYLDGIRNRTNYTVIKCGKAAYRNCLKKREMSRVAMDFKKRNFCNILFVLTEQEFAEGGFINLNAEN